MEGSERLCFLVTANHSSTEKGIERYCRENEGELLHATNKSAFRLLEQFLYTIQSSAGHGNSPSPCVVTGHANASSYSTLPLIQQSAASNSTTHTCAIRASNQWNLQGCDVNNCDRLCIAPRHTSPVIGTFVQHATDAAINGHVITSMLVDDVMVCARECLLYRNCVSFNYEYIPTTGRELPNSGMICELNDETKNSCSERFHKRDGYKYYEKLKM
ncbi:hypothetical protein OS493_026590 [Desmophyllum pertusum]|uniref:Apple domain-containing protein n=1 Tax=Desmophyllum pertusum TaxID=174260 RepID=A0A9X0CD63_9CNID|nr:hypothetical protein OS493_026590 [Desmophyllum pertusum]